MVVWHKKSFTKKPTVPVILKTAVDGVLLLKSQTKQRMSIVIQHYVNCLTEKIQKI